MKVPNRCACARPGYRFVFASLFVTSGIACGDVPVELGARSNAATVAPAARASALEPRPDHARATQHDESHLVAAGQGMSAALAGAWHGVEAPLRSTGRLFAVCPSREITVADSSSASWVLALVTLDGRIDAETTHNPAGGLMSAGSDVTRSRARLIVRRVHSRETRVAQGASVSASWISRVVEFDHTHSRIGERGHPSEAALRTLSQSSPQGEFVAVLLPTSDGTNWTLEALHEVSDGRLAREGLGVRAGTSMTELFSLVEQGGAR